MSQALQDDADATKPTTAEFEDQGEAFSRAVERELRQVLALVELAEREQDRAAAVGLRITIAKLGLFTLIPLFVVAFSGVETARLLEEAPSSLVGEFLISLMTLGIPGFVFGMMWVASSQKQRKHKKTAAEVAETIREVVSVSNWQAKLDPLDWAHLRTRIANLELVELSSLSLLERVDFSGMK